MTTLQLIVMAAMAVVGAEESKADAIKDEIKKFAGTWKLVAANFDNEEKTPEDVKTASLVVEGDGFTLKIGDAVHKGKFVIDPTKKPKTIDVEFTEGSLKDSKVLGVYQIDGNKRKSCFSVSDKDRPEDLAPGKGRYVWTWQADKQ
jgi:uncharacterized protein (TIGR03067 family)